MGGKEIRIMHNQALEMDWAKPCRFWKAVFER